MPVSATVGEQLVPVQFTVKVVEFTCAEFALKLTAPVVQEAPEASKVPGVQVPTVTLKFVMSVSEKIEVLKYTGPPVAVMVIVPQLIALPPTVIEPQASAV